MWWAACKQINKLSLRSAGLRPPLCDDGFCNRLLAYPQLKRAFSLKCVLHQCLSETAGLLISTPNLSLRLKLMCFTSAWSEPSH